MTARTARKDIEAGRKLTFVIVQGLIGDCVSLQAELAFI